MKALILQIILLKYFLAFKKIKILMQVKKSTLLAHKESFEIKFLKLFKNQEVLEAFV